MVSYLDSAYRRFVLVVVGLTFSWAEVAEVPVSALVEHLGEVEEAAMGLAPKVPDLVVAAFAR